MAGTRCMVGGLVFSVFDPELARLPLLVHRRVAPKIQKATEKAMAHVPLKKRHKQVNDEGVDEENTVFGFLEKSYVSRRKPSTKIPTKLLNSNVNFHKRWFYLNFNERALQYFKHEKELGVCAIFTLHRS